MVIGMKMFLGEYNPNITGGSRIALPKKIREQLGSGSVVLTRGLEKCIYVYDKSDWMEQAQKQIDTSAVDEQNTKIRDLERFTYASAEEVSIDSQGRVVIPSVLLKYAGIEEKTAVIGVGSRVEIWDQDSWKEHYKKVSADLAA